MRGGRFLQNYGDYPPAGTPSQRKHCANPGSSHTPSKQRKIYEVWPGKLPDRFKPQQNNTKDEVADRMGHQNFFSDKRHSGSSGSFQPMYPAGPGDMYSQNRPPRPVYPPDLWWGGGGMGYSPNMPNSGGNMYRYPEPTNMFRDYPPLFPDRHIPPQPMYSYQQTPTNPVKRTVNIRNVKVTRESPKIASTSKEVEPKTSTPVKHTESLDKSFEKPKRKKIFIATNVRGVQAWSEVKNEVIIIFEIIGLLNSQVTKTASARCKSFMLKDAQGHQIKCEFFETDRELGRMCRGKTYRCTGEYSARRGVFHAVSVREASDMDLRLYRKNMAVTNCALKTYK